MKNEPRQIVVYAAQTRRDEDWADAASRGMVGLVSSSRADDDRRSDSCVTKPARSTN